MFKAVIAEMKAAAVEAARKASAEMLCHADFDRHVAWPGP